MKISEPPVIVEHSFKKDSKTVWNAITKHEEMIKWYFENIPNFEPKIGFQTEFLVQSEERKFLHKWNILEVEPLKKISYNWQFEEYEGSSNSIFELFEEGDSVRLKLTCEVLENFSDDIPEFRRESCLGGWNYFIKERLAGYLEK